MARIHSIVCAATLVLSGRSLQAAEGSGEVLIGSPGPAGTYLESLQEHGSARWERNFLVMAATRLKPDDPLNNPSLRVVLELTAARAGALVSARVKESSGVANFDGAALEVAKDSFPLKAAPEEALSDDNQVHFVWAFARDDRRCLEVRLIHVEAPLEEALPRLLSRERDGEALRRVQAAQSVESALSLFAAAWLGRALGSPAIAPEAAVALAAAGHHVDESFLQQALRRTDLADGLAAAAARAKVAVCALLRERLESPASPEQAAVARALRLSGDPACAPALIAIAHATSSSVAARAAAIEALGSISDPAARKALKDLATEGTAPLRAAAIVALSPPGGGNAALFRLAPLLHDPALEVRVAAITGLLRAVGEPSLMQFYLLFGEKDPRPYQAAAAGLAHLSSEPSAALLVRMLRKEDRRIRIAAAAALASRTDAYARKALEAVRNDAAPELRVFAASLLEPLQRRELVASLGAKGAEVYPALVTGSARPAAADWLLAAFTKAPPAARVDLLATWLAASPAPDSVAITR